MIDLDRILRGLENYIQRYISHLAAAAAAKIPIVDNDEKYLQHLIKMYKFINALKTFPLPIVSPPSCIFRDIIKKEIADNDEFISTQQYSTSPTVRYLFENNLLGDVIRIAEWWNKNIKPYYKKYNAPYVCLHLVQCSDSHLFFFRIYFSSPLVRRTKIYFYFKPLYTPVITRELTPVRLLNGLAFIDEEELSKLLLEKEGSE